MMTRRNQEHMQPQRRLLSDDLWVLSGRVGASGASLVLSMLLAQALSVSDLGTYFTVLSVVAPAVVLAQFGLGPVAVCNVVLSLETADRVLCLILAPQLVSLHAQKRIAELSSWSGVRRHSWAAWHLWVG
jgi:hypothetical protein